MADVDRLERFWRDMALMFSETVKIKGAVARHVLGMPIPPFNHVMSVDVNEDEAEDFLKTVIKHFSSRKLPFACFRVSPLTRPTSFTSLLELHGFQKSSEASIMVFEGKPAQDKLNRDVKIKEISESGVGTFSRLTSTLFEDPPDGGKRDTECFSN